MEARTATRQDLSHVFAHLAVRISQEFSAAGETEGSAKEHLLMDLREGRGHALREGDQILAVITWHEDDGKAYTSFAANEAFFAAKTVRFWQTTHSENPTPLRQYSCPVGDLE